MSNRITRSGFPIDDNSVPAWTIDDGRVADLGIEHPAPPPSITKPRPRLTPEQRGRFWQSVADTSAAAKATSSQGFKHGEVNHE